jgi:hypothetical protein
MAGRPRMMAGKGTELEEAALELSMRAFDAVPSVYQQRKGGNDPLAAAWNEVVDSAMRASIACERLGHLLRARAGITGPSPTQKLLEEPSGTDSGGTSPNGL